jgi:hypothetical protein
MIIREDINGDAVGVDSFADQPGAVAAFARTIVGAALCGSAAIGDAIIDLFVENTKVATLANTKTNVEPNRDDIIPMAVPVPAGARIGVHVTDAAGSACNAVVYTSP